jgi:tellurite methyltransferase
VRVTSEWTPYYEYAGDDPRETLLDALARFAEPGFAVDLGCGTGRDTFELLRRGWRVLAIDAEREALERLLAHGELDLSRLETQLARFEDAAWPDADLVNASFALPFCGPEHFRALWRRVVASLRRARFCGQLFGDRDEWASTHAEMTFHTRGEVERLLSGLDVERLDEVEEDGPTALEPVKHWHVFHVVARRPLTGGGYARADTQQPSAQPLVSSVSYVSCGSCDLPQSGSRFGEPPVSATEPVVKPDIMLDPLANVAELLRRRV